MAAPRKYPPELKERALRLWRSEQPRRPRTFFSILKVEPVYRTSFRTREEAELALFRYIDGLVQPHRIQQALGWRRPRRLRGCLLGRAGRPTRFVYHPVRPHGRQVAHPPENRGNLT
jgi:hypothetical protein